MIFDTHAHYDDEAFDEDRTELLGRLQEAGIGAVMNVAASLERCRSTIKLAEAHDWIYGSVGVHPSETGEMDQEGLQWIKEQCDRPVIKAVGEIGLDYYWEEPAHDIQKKWFEAQMDLARQVKLPIIIHSRDAAKDTLDMMKAAKAGEIGGVVHCFSYTREMAREYLDMGFFLGIGGVLTFNNARKLKEVVEYIPLESIVLETDCPYLAPVPNRGKRNSSLELPYVVEAVSRLKGVDPETVMKATWENGKKLYRL